MNIFQKKHFKFYLLLIYFYIIIYNEEFGITKTKNINNSVFRDAFEIPNDDNMYINLTLGNYSEFIINSGNTLKINASVNKKFSFLSFEVIPNYGKIQVSIIHNEKNINVISYKSYFYTYKNENESDFNDRLLQIKCEEGLSDSEIKKCVVQVIIYTEDNIINLEGTKIKDLPLFKYISKNNNNSYEFVSGDNELYLNIETFSGNIGLNSDNYYEILSTNEKIKLYKFPENTNVSIQIFGKEDSFYSIYDYTITYIQDNSFIVGSSYILTLTESQLKTIKLLDYYYYYEQKETSYFIGIYSPDNTINVKLKGAWNQNGPENLNELGLNQIISSSDLDYDFIIIKKQINMNKYNDYVLCYEIDNITGISLANGIEYYFIFNNNNNILNFSYPHTQKEKDINITFKLRYDLDKIIIFTYPQTLKEKKFNKTSEISKEINDIKICPELKIQQDITSELTKEVYDIYKIKILLNGLEYKIRNYQKTSNVFNILINSNESDFSNCFNFSSICKVFLFIELINGSQEKSVLNISINTVENKPIENEEEIEE